ncbi:MAG: FMN-binding protein [Omnitrophica bacterium]|nr:FMN-binding protein [Candidatus Omnitrophota bacterium]
MIALIVLVSGISAGLLVTINICTKDRIAWNKEIKLKKSVLNVFGIPYKKNEIINVFGKKVEIGELGGRPFYRYYERGKVSGIAIEIKGAGFWGPISALVALKPGLGTIKGVEILHQEETPGLGGRIAEDEFKDQFKGRSVEPEISVDAITGATMTSKAFKKIINENVKSFKDEFKKK